MPSSNMTEEQPFKLPKDEPLPATLTSVTTKTIEWTVKQGPEMGTKKSRDLWTWEFALGGDYAGLKAFGETDSKLTNHPDNKVRQWGETLTGVQYQLGDGINTDDLVGLSCAVVCDHQVRDKPDGNKFYGTPVVDVLPADVVGMSDPPF